MTTKSHNIRIDEKVKEEAAAMPGGDMQDSRRFGALRVGSIFA